MAKDPKLEKLLKPNLQRFYKNLSRFTELLTRLEVLDPKDLEVILEPETRTKLVDMHSAAQENLYSLLTSSKKNDYIAKPSFLDPQTKSGLFGRSAPLCSPEGEFKYYQSIRNGLEIAILKGYIPSIHPIVGYNPPKLIKEIVHDLEIPLWRENPYVDKFEKVRRKDLDKGIKGELLKDYAKVQEKVSKLISLQDKNNSVYKPDYLRPTIFHRGFDQPLLSLDSEGGEFDYFCNIRDGLEYALVNRIIPSDHKIYRYNLPGYIENLKDKQKNP